jgi:hypothetical protein
MLSAHAPSLLAGLGRASLAAAFAPFGGHELCWRGFSAAADAPPPPGAAQQNAAGRDGSAEERAASLPVEQAAKALLAGNVRGQLTTVRAGLAAADEERQVDSSVVGYVCSRGEAPVLLLSPDDAQHLRNIEENPKVQCGLPCSCHGNTPPPPALPPPSPPSWFPGGAKSL